MLMVISSASSAVFAMNYHFSEANISESIEICLLYFGSIFRPAAGFIRTRICDIRKILRPSLFRHGVITVKTDSYEAGRQWVSLYRVELQMRAPEAVLSDIGLTLLVTSLAPPIRRISAGRAALRMRSWQLGRPPKDSFDRWSDPSIVIPGLFFSGASFGVSLLCSS